MEFSSKLVKVGHGHNRRSMKLQLWDTAGQERFRSLTRGYYRGTAGVLLAFDLTSRSSFNKLQDFISDIRSLTAPSVSIVVFGNKDDLEIDDPTMTVSRQQVVDFCIKNGDIPLIVGSAKTGDNIEEAFMKLASMIVTKIELGVIEPDDMDSGVQYGDIPRWDVTVSRRRAQNWFFRPGPSSGDRSERSRGSWCC